MQFFSNLRLASKIVMLLGILGASAVIITLYSMLNLHAVDRDYRFLLSHDAEATRLIGDALLDLSDASRLVFAVLTEQEEARMRATQGQLDELQTRFRARIEAARPLIEQPTPGLDIILLQERQVFAHAAAIIDAAARWRGDRALQIIHQQFDPQLHELRQNMDELRDTTVAHYQITSSQLNATTQATLVNTALAFGLALVGIIGLSAYLSITQISSPITQLTRIMGRLTDRHYQEPITFTERRDEVGQMAQALQVFRDGMQRADRLELEAAASAEARRVSQQLVELTDAMPGAVFQLHVDVHGRQHFVFLSGKAAEFLGHDAHALGQAGLLLDGIAADGPDARQTAHQALARSLRDLQPLDVDMRLERDGRDFWLKTLATVRRASDGGILLNGIWLDISDMKAQARALEAAKELAEQAAQAKAAFLATMSHEIRTPMNAILGLTQLSLKHSLEARQRERVEKILRAGQHLLGIINDILDFSKIDSGQQRLEHIPFHPQQLLDDVREMLAERAADKHLTLHVEAADNLPGLLGDPLRISQILLNYANNAIKFSQQGSISLRLRVHQEPDGPLYLHGEVEDQGIGLDDEQVQRLFQPFQQADTSITRRFGGTGLGLAISRSLAELMGGSVGVRSAPGEGSLFWFRVQVEPHGATDARPVPISPVNPVALTGMRVLLVDDNELNRLVAGELLKEAGLLVDMAHDGRQAITCLEQAEDGRYDAVLMDMMMPELDGLSATRLLRENPRFRLLPVIAMTANASQADVEHCLAAGMDAHIAKPIDEQMLWKTLLHCLTLEGPPAVLDSHPADSDASAPVLDPRQLEHLRRLVSAERFRAMLRMLADDCRQRGQTFASLASSGDLDALQRQAHDLISTAGHAGLKRLVNLGQALRRALHEQDRQRTQHLANAIQQATLEAIEHLDQHFGYPLPAEPSSQVTLPQNTTPG